MIGKRATIKMFLIYRKLDKQHGDKLCEKRSGGNRGEPRKVCKKPRSEDRKEQQETCQPFSPLDVRAGCSLYKYPHRYLELFLEALGRPLTCLLLAIQCDLKTRKRL